MNKEFDKKVGRNIRLVRMKRGYSQEYISSQLQLRGCDITRSALAKIEVGQRHIYPDEIVSLAKTLSVSYEELLDV